MYIYGFGTYDTRIISKWLLTNIEQTNIGINS